MATITPPAVNARNLGEYQRQVRSPLARLRGYIYLYVGIEAALLLVLLAALCFWASLLLDYGLFKASAFDWVQQGAWAWWTRLGLLVTAVVGVLAIVTWTVLARLLRQFSDASLALVLERRFPQLLGDRLITAVELSDLRRAVEQGYSPAMVVETTHEAAERVGKVPVGKVFDWGRLVFRGGLALSLTLGLYALAGGLFWFLDRAYHAAGRTGYSRFNEVVQMWSERDVLLRRTVWPRRAQLAFLNVPESGLWAGVGGAPPQVHLRAVEYVIADPDSWDGWSALTWDDLVRRPDLIRDAGSSETYVPSIRLKGQENWGGVTVDEVARKLGKPEEGSRSALNGWEIRMEPAGAGDDPKSRDLQSGDLAAVKNVLDHVNASVQNPAMSRTMRRLEMPDSVFLVSSGCKSPPQPELKRGDENEYTYEFTKLEFEPTDKQRVVHFSVRAADYTTPQRTITVVDPPDLDGVQLQESRPAYLYYPPRPTEKPEDAVTLAFLRGQKQLFEARNILPRDSDSARIDVPAGTDLVLTGEATQDLKEAFLDLTPGKTDKDVTSLRVRLDPSKVKPGDPRSAFLVGGEPGGKSAQWLEAPLSAKPVPGDERSWVLQTTRRDEVKGEPARGEPLRLPLEIRENAQHRQREFRIELCDVRRSLSFALEFTGNEGITASKRLDVQVQPDAAPVIQDVGVVGLRSEARTSGEGEKKVFYYVTPRARIPVSGRVGDDHCLGDVTYHVTVRPATAAAPPEPGKPAKPAPEAPGRDYAYQPPGFLELVGQAQDGLTLGQVRDLLGQPQQLPYRQPLLQRSMEVHADTINVGFDAPKPPKRPSWHDAQDATNKLHWDLPLWQYNVTLDDDHPLYRMDLRLEAADTDADDQTAPDGSPLPHRSQSSATYTFLMVRDNYLKGLIGQDEAKQYKDLNLQFQNLAGLATDVGVFKAEATAFADHRLKDDGDLRGSEDVLDFLQEVTSKVETAHRVNDPEKFLLNSPAYKTLSEAVKAASRTTTICKSRWTPNSRRPTPTRSGSRSRATTSSRTRSGC